jgi:hypothetical protein
MRDVGVLDRQPTKGSTEVDECGLAEIGNSKKETRGTQFRQVRAAMCKYPTSCMLRSFGLIGCVYKMMQMMREGSLPRLI